MNRFLCFIIIILFISCDKKEKVYDFKVDELIFYKFIGWQGKRDKIVCFNLKLNYHSKSKLDLDILSDFILKNNKNNVDRFYLFDDGNGSTEENFSEKDSISIKLRLDFEFYGDSLEDMYQEFLSSYNSGYIINSKDLDVKCEIKNFKDIKVEFHLNEQIINYNDSLNMNLKTYSDLETIILEKVQLPR